MEGMTMEVGDRIIRKFDRRAGFVHDVRIARTVMVEVRWDDTDGRQWLPAEEFQPWTQADPPPPPATVTRLGRTTPAYLLDLRRKNPLKKDSTRERKLAEQQLANDLAGLSGRKKTKSRSKAKKLIKRFEYGSAPQNMRRKWQPNAEFGTTFARREARTLTNRIDRDKT
jgi:hypothetical protein